MDPHHRFSAMNNRRLVQDYIERATHWLAAIDVLFRRESWGRCCARVPGGRRAGAEVGLARVGIEIPQVHDVSEILMAHNDRLPKRIQSHLARLCNVSRSLRRDRELAFYGSEDLTPSDFYKRADADRARADARWTVGVVRDAIKAGPRTGRSR
jgi:hypothetical protein